MIVGEGGSIPVVGDFERILGAPVLLASAALLLRSFWTLAHVDPGFRAEGVLTVPVDLPRATYADIAARPRWLGVMLVVMGPVLEVPVTTLFAASLLCIGIYFRLMNRAMRGLSA